MSWSRLMYHLIRDARENRVPLTGSFELTPRCNLNCAMCYVNRPALDSFALSHEVTAEDWIGLAREARDSGMLRILFTGGEVFLRKDFQRIYEEISRMGLLVQIYTNATLINPAIAKWLGAMPPSQLGVSLYGASPDTYAQVCGDPNAYAQAMRGVELLIDAGIKPEIRMTIIRKNVHDFDALLKFADDRKLIFLKALYISPRRDDDLAGPLLERLSPEEIIHFTETHFVESGVSWQDEMPEKSKDKSTLNSSEKENPLPCGAGQDSFWITWDGRMTFCGDIDTPYTLPFRDGFMKAWQEMQKIVDDLPICIECQQCELKDDCIQCPGRLKCESGSFDKAAPYFCESAKAERAFVNKRKKTSK